MIVDSTFHVIASSDPKAILGEQLRLVTEGRNGGSYLTSDGCTVCFAITPGYESYLGLVWRDCPIT
jgi:hypothetical protein